MTRVLITAAAGPIGRTACRHFAEAGYATTALVLDDPGHAAPDFPWSCASYYGYGSSNSHM